MTEVLTHESAPAPAPPEPNTGASNKGDAPVETAPEPTEEQTLPATFDNLSPAEDAPAAEDDAPEAAPERTGKWNCLGEKCAVARIGGFFTGPTQSVAQSSGQAVTCPECSGTSVIFAGENETED